MHRRVPTARDAEHFILPSTSNIGRLDQLRLAWRDRQWWPLWTMIGRSSGAYPEVRRDARQQQPTPMWLQVLGSDRRTGTLYGNAEVTTIYRDLPRLLTLSGTGCA